MKLKIHEAEAECVETAGWTCISCPKMIEQHEAGPYCMTCRMHWEDVDKGLYEDWN